MMRAPITIVLLFALDAALYWGVSRLWDERDELTRRRADLTVRIESSRENGQSERRFRDLIDRASSSMKHDASDIATVRDLLLASERGLDVDRFSLDFRAAQNDTGGRVGASLGGSFDAVYDYLRRVEALRLPLVLEEVSLREESPGRIRVDLQWLVRFRADGGAGVDFSPAEMGRLEAWLSRELDEDSGRDPFSQRGSEPEEERMPAVSEPRPIVEDSLIAEPVDDLAAPAGPELAGFVLARPELESDVNRRVLAAIRFEGELLLVGVGEQVGNFRVERIDARESVTLVDLETGEPLTLLLE